MCDFFSFVTDNRKYYYFDWAQRQAILKKELKLKSGQIVDEADSHSEICAYYNLNCDMVNKYEYNPLTEKFIIDQQNISPKSKQAQIWVGQINWKTIVEPLIIKKIKHPLKGKPKNVDGEIINLFKQCVIIGNSVERSVENSIWCAVWDAVGNHVRAFAWNFVSSTVDSFIGNFVCGTVWSSIMAYYSTFFEIKYKYDYSPYWKLWDRGFVLSFDGNKWRLHSGKNAKVVYEI